MLRLNTKAAPVVVIALLIASYVWYSLEAAHVNAVLAGTLPLQKPLEELPYALGEWQGKDAPLSEAVVKVAAADHHVSRYYHNRRTGAIVNLYIPYYGNPRTMVGHCPEVCYPATGWKTTDNRVESIPRGGTQGTEHLPVVLNRFERGPAKVTVITFYIVGGTYTADRKVAERAAKIGVTADNRNYLMQVWLTFAGHPSRHELLRVSGGFLEELLPVLESHLPSPEATRILATEE
jgi:EpsI family protein